MTIMAIDSVLAHIDDLHREAEHRRRVAAVRSAKRAQRPAARTRAFLQVRRALSARV